MFQCDKKNREKYERKFNIYSEINCKTTLYIILNFKSIYNHVYNVYIRTFYLL